MADQAYGSYNKQTKTWNGMIGELLSGVSHSEGGSHHLQMHKFRIFKDCMYKYLNVNVIKLRMVLQCWDVKIWPS